MRSIQIPYGKGFQVLHVPEERLKAVIVPKHPENRQADQQAIVRQAMEDSGIIGKAGEYIASLSDGERQKAMIARALAQQTPIIILDEPTAFLDVASRIETMRLLQILAHERGKAVLLSSHDISQSLLLADELWLITTDRQVITGKTPELVASGAMDRLFDNRSIHFNNQILDYSF